MRTAYAERETEGDWATFARIADYFVNRVPLEDWEDFRQDLLVEMARVKAKYEAKGKPLTEASLMLVAKYQLKKYWYKRKFRLFGVRCSSCTIEQREECYSTKMPSECPKGKAHRLLSLDWPDKNDDGDKPTPLREKLADKKGVDLAARLDARLILHLLPKRIIQIGYKVYTGAPLEVKERDYLKHWQLVHPACFDLLPKRLFLIGYKIYTGIPLGTEEENYLKHWQELRSARFDFRQDHPGERILKLLRKKPQGISRRDLGTRLQIPVWELNLQLEPLIESQQVIALNRENARGRPLTPLLFLSGVEIPEGEKIKTPRDERIRQAYFKKGWSIKKIKSEMHHDKRTVRRAIYNSQVQAQS